MQAHERGGVAVVLLHGWGASGDDLVPLAHDLARPGMRFYVPAAPLPEVGGGRAWWHIGEDAPAKVLTDDQAVRSSPPSPHPELRAARAAVLDLVRNIRKQQAPQLLVVAGFSQGAMLALDVGLTGDQAAAVDRVAVLSGALLAETVPALNAADRRAGPAVMLVHGRQDPVVPFEAGLRVKAALEKAGLDVAWHPFDGGHEIPGQVVQALSDFLSPGS